MNCNLISLTKKNKDYVVVLEISEKIEVKDLRVCKSLSYNFIHHPSQLTISIYFQEFLRSFVVYVMFFSSFFLLLFVGGE